MRSPRNHLQKICVSKATIQRTDHENLQYKSYIMKRGQFISETSKENCLARSKRQNQTEQNILWFISVEKNFDQDQKVNRRNKRWLYADPSKVLRVMHTNFAATYGFRIIKNEGHVMPPHFFPQRLLLILMFWIMLLSHGLRWVKNGMCYYFLQDCTIS